MLLSVSALQAAVLGAVQGLTEFLPVSSSAHLYVVPTLLGWPYAGVAFDVALHWGTLVALLAAFGGDWWKLGKDLLGSDPESRRDAGGVLLRLAVGTPPAGLAGPLFKDVIQTPPRSLPLHAAMLHRFGAPL